MDKPNSASPVWPRLALLILTISAVSHLVMFFGGVTHDANFINAIFIVIVSTHYIFTMDRQQRWTGVLLIVLYLLTLNTGMGHLTLAVANFLAFDIFWKRAWTSQT